MSILYHVDKCDASSVVGWAVHRSGIKEVRLFADGVAIGRAAVGVPRGDVHQAYPTLTDSARSGFLFPLESVPLRREGTDLTIEFVSRDGTVARETRQVTRMALREKVTDNLFRPGVDAPLRSGLPFEVTKLLHTLAPGTYPPDRVWGDELMLRAVADLKKCWVNEARAPSLNRYVLFLKAMYHRFRGIRSRFPKSNAHADLGAKDAVGVATDPEEMLAIANHLYVLKSNGLDGYFLEFGCFKGHSSCCLSQCCHELGLRMEVFDSFAGLPPSDSAYYAAGEFCGTLEEVTGHLREFGQPQVVGYNKGYFCDTVPSFAKGPLLCVWMDVDLVSSARDVAPLLDRLPRASALFTHEFPPDGAEGGRLVLSKSEVFPPLHERFRSLGRSPVARYLCGCTGALWDADEGIPVLPFDALMSLARLGE
jgi:O-methyltransferase